MNNDRKLTVLTTALPYIGVLVAILIGMATSGCLPTLEPTPTAVPTDTPPPTPTHDVFERVTITGDVNIRDGQDVVRGWLKQGDQVFAICTGDWCYLGDGLKIWRGCTSDNPYNQTCTRRP
jgi:hypothetical protein